MKDQPHSSPDDQEREEQLEKELVHAHTEEEKLERELDRVQQEERRIEEELEQNRHDHHRKRFFLVFIINGEDFKVETNVEDLLRTAVEKALEVSGNTGRRDPLEWEVRNSAGFLLEMAREIRALGLEDGARLFLSLKVGAGGDDASRS
jgi:predicted RNase H-like nuclease (RuvC/YqgF family)